MAECDDCNVFAKCRFLRHVGKLMLPLVMAFVSLSYWATASELVEGMRVAQGVMGTACRLLLLLVFTGLVFMLLWSYFACMVTDAGRVPRGWHPFRDEEQAITEMESLLDRGGRGPGDKRDVTRPRFCRKCRAWKPPRAHHCSVSGRCILRLDHYCIWVLNAVGLLNYKAFLLFLLYTLAATSLACVVLLSSVVRFIRDDGDDGTAAGGGAVTGRGLMLLIAFVADAAFALSLLAFVILHARLAGLNMTTIEQFEKTEVVPWPWDRGSFKKNLAEVFGSRPDRWWRPHLTREEAAATLRAALCM